MQKTLYKRIRNFPGTTENLLLSSSKLSDSFIYCSSIFFSGDDMNKRYLYIEIEMKTISPFVSGEIKQEHQERGAPKPVRKTADGKVATPIYGALRAYLEKTLRAKGENICDSGKKTCGHCVLCNLFGSLGKGGRAVIDDLVSDKPASEIVKPVIHLRLNRENNTVADSRKQEEAHEGAIFKGRIIIDNPGDRDLALIQTGIEAINEFGLGGWRTRGRGKVNMKITKVEKRNWATFEEKGKEIAGQLLPL